MALHDDPIGLLEDKGNRIAGRTKHFFRSPAASAENFIGHQGSYVRDRKGWAATIMLLPLAVGHYLAWAGALYMGFRAMCYAVYAVTPLRKRMETNEGDKPGRHSLLKPEEEPRPSQQKVNRLAATVRPRWDPDMAAHKTKLSKNKAEVLGLSPKLYPNAYQEDSGPEINDPPGPPSGGSSGQRVRPERAWMAYEGTDGDLPPVEQQPGEQLRPGPTALDAVQKEKGLEPSSGPSQMVLPGA